MCSMDVSALSGFSYQAHPFGLIEEETGEVETRHRPRSSFRIITLAST